MLLYLLIKPNILVKVLKSISSLHPYLKKINPELILVSACGSVIMPLGFILSRFMEKKIICCAHGDDFLVHTRYSLKSRYLKAIDKIITSCNKMNFLIKKINNLKDNKLTIIPRGLYLPDYEIRQNKEDARKELKIHNIDFILVSVGNHTPRKNFQIAIRAMKKIKELYPQLKFKYYLIGKGPESQKLKTLTKNLKLEEEVSFIGSVNDAKKNMYLKASDIFVLPSISSNKTIEGFGIAFLEANFFKLPVIGTTSGGIIEAIDHNKSGLLIEPNNLNDLVKAIIYLYENEEERKKMGEYGYRRVINKYNWNILIDKYIKLFQETIKQVK